MLTLESVEALPATTRAGVVASAMQYLRRSPVEPAPNEPDAEVARVVADARLLLQQRRNRATMLWSYLADSMIAAPGDPRRQAATRRLARKGLLKPDQFKLELPKAQLRNAQAHGVRRQHILSAVAQAIEEPNGFEVVGRFGAFYVFAASPETSGADPFSLLIGTTIIGSRMVFEWAFRAYHSDLPINPTDSPLARLSKLVDEYGLRFRLNDDKWHLFAKEAIIPSNTRLKLERDTKESTNDFFATLTFDVGEVDTEIALAFVIDSDRYADCLRQHGTHVRR